MAAAEVVMTDADDLVREKPMMETSSVVGSNGHRDSKTVVSS